LSRNIIDKASQNEAETSDQGLKLKIEKGIILVAVLIMMTALFLVPKYQTYAFNKAVLQKKSDISTQFPEEMSKEAYLSEVGRIREKLEESRNDIPESIDTVGLYYGMVQMAEEAEVALVSVEFNALNTQIEDAVGVKIDKAFIENEDKTIKGPDGRYLASCSFTVVCSGNEANFIRFLQALEVYRPIVKVIDTEIKGEVLSGKTMTLKLESYGTVDEVTKEKADQNS
jgi:hypothetical protein